MRTRLIPLLLLSNGGFYKTEKFSAPKYLGDPMNIIKIFNEKEVDELIVLDIDAARDGTTPDLETLKDISEECFCPLSYGGGITDVDTATKIVSIGFEKIIVNSATFHKPQIVADLARVLGRSSVVGSIDVKKNWRGVGQVFVNGGQTKIPASPVEWARELEDRGAGEICINSIDRDGKMIGYDLDLVQRIVEAVDIPVIAAGGAGSMQDIQDVIRTAGASAAAAGSFFVFQGKHRAVLLSYPDETVRQF